MKLIILLISCLFSLETWAEYHQFEHDLNQDHAEELLGKNSYLQLAIGEMTSLDVHYELKNLVKVSLHEKHRELSMDVFKAIVRASRKYHLDPFLLSAVILGESSFDPYSVGTSGEVGLMQLLPKTAKWIATKFNVDYTGVKSLKDPMVNIMIGTAYLSYLRTKYASTPDYYLSAYNMGPGNLRSALAKNIRPKDYPIHVMKRYLKIYRGIQKRKKWLKYYVFRV